MAAQIVFVPLMKMRDLGKLNAAVAGWLKVAAATFALASLTALSGCSGGDAADGANAGATQTPLPVLSGFSNLTRENTSRIAAALARVRQGSGSARILVIGDSVTAGSKTGTDGFYRDAARHNFASILADDVESRLALAASRDSFLGQNNIHGTYPDYNPRVHSVGAFKETGSNPRFASLGGALFRSTGQSGSFNYRPTRPADHFEIRYAATDGESHFRYRIGQADWRAAPATAGPRYMTATIDLPHPAREEIEIAPLGEGALIHGIIAQDSTRAQVEIVAAGFAGSTATRSWINKRNSWSPLTRVAEEPADLKIIALGTNDINKDISVDEYLAAMRRIVEAAKKKSDVLILGPGPLQSNSLSKSALRQKDFRNALAQLAEREGVAFGDTYGWFGGSFEAATEKGLMADSLHPSPAGAAKISDFLLAFLRHLSAGQTGSALTLREADHR